ncbi:MAG: CPBP family intramembrane metalloprotease [Oscillospiraceae bacterium]|nr:CPBP family intramembrane metalloprotease [Oscillospiraceae bacterium]
MDERMRRKLLRRDIGSYGWALLIYYLLMTLCVTAAMMIQSAVLLITGDVPEETALMGNGWGYLTACLLAVLLIRIWKGKAFFTGMWKSDRRMTQGAFWQLLCLTISVQLVFQLLAIVMETLLNLMGLSIIESMEMASGMPDTFSMFLYYSLGAPVVEEIIFRGAILRGLERYGKRFAIWTSAFLFGIFHGNLIQSPYAFLVGLILGYVAMEYNVFWAMVLHMVNNLVLGDILPRLTQGMGDVAAALLNQGVIWLSVIIALISLIRNRRQIREYRRSDLPSLECIGAFAISPGVILLTLLMAVNALTMLIL